MVWGASVYDGVGKPHRIQDIMMKDKNHDIFQEEILPSKYVFFVHRAFIFNEDNDSKYNTKMKK